MDNLNSCQAGPVSSFFSQTASRAKLCVFTRSVINSLGVWHELTLRSPSPTALPPHGEPAVLSRSQAIPVCPVCPRVYGVRTGVSAVPEPVHTCQERLPEAHGHVWSHLARGDGVQQVLIQEFWKFKVVFERRYKVYIGQCVKMLLPYNCSTFLKVNCAVMVERLFLDMVNRKCFLTEMVV